MTSTRGLLNHSHLEEALSNVLIEIERPMGVSWESAETFRRFGGLQSRVLLGPAPWGLRHPVQSLTRAVSHSLITMSATRAQRPSRNCLRME